MDLTVANGMGAEEAVNKIHAIDHEAKVIVSSGNIGSTVMANFRKYGFCGALYKPFKIAAMSKILCEVIA